MYWSLGNTLRSDSTLDAGSTTSHTLDLTADNLERGLLQIKVTFPSADHQGVLMSVGRSIDTSTLEDVDTAPARLRVFADGAVQSDGTVISYRVISFDYPYLYVHLENLDKLADCSVEIKYSFGFYP